MTTDIAKNLAAIKQQIRDYEVLYSRKPHSVYLVAASKGQSIEQLRQAITAGQTAFGENFVQEALLKIKAFADINLDWHFLGSIQSNKTKKIAENFNWVHGISHTHIAQRLNDQRPIHLPSLNICLEVNISEEITKSGTSYLEALSLAEFCMKLPRLKLRGLMAIPAPQNCLITQKMEFKKLCQLFDELNKKNFQLDTLSMGMSNDFEAAIAEGATIVRVGTAIFGAR